MTAATRILGTPHRAGTESNGPVAVVDLHQSIAGYTIVQAIGHGGMGSVYEVRHNTLDKRFALKLISESLRDNSEAVDRFRSETLALGKLEHPNIVLAVDAGVWDGRPFLVTELLKGQDLASRVTEDGKLDVESVISIAMQVADALTFAHNHGYFHRDIKPSNIFYQPDGKAKLLDFGLVRSESNHSLTRAGCLMGTVDFVSPEQACNAAQAGAASDIYSLGCTLIYLLSGEVPFPDRRYPSLAAKLQSHLNDVPEWLQLAKEEYPGWLIDLIQAMIAKNPADRPGSSQLVYSTLQSRAFSANRSSASTKQITKKGRFSTGQKLALSSSIAISVAGIAWTLGGANTSPKPSHASEELDSRKAIENPRRTDKENLNASAVILSEEKTLPVSITHNARGALMPRKQLDKGFAQPSVFLSKDAGHD